MNNAVTLRSDGARHELLLDGEPLHGVRAVTITAAAGNYVEVQVDLLIRRDFLTEVFAAQGVTVPAKTHEALVRLGWTPPQSDVPGA